MSIRNILFSVLVLASPALLAAPQPKTVTNKVDAEAGELLITVQGQDFGSGPNVLFFNDFRGEREGTALKSTKPEVGKMSFGVDEPILGSYRGQKGFLAIDEKSQERNILRAELGGQYSSVFVAYSVAVPEGHTGPSQTKLNDWGGSTWKFIWLLEEEGADSNDSQFDMVLPQQNSDMATIHGNASKFTRVGSGAAWPFARFSEWWSWGDYHHINGWVSAHEKDARDSSGGFSVLSKEYSLLERGTHNVDEDLELSGPGPSISQVNFPGWVRKTDEDNFQAIYTNLYVAGGANMLARVELTDNADYRASDYRKVLLPEVWTAERIDTSINLELLRHEGPLYIHVFNASGQRSSPGLLACQKCPAMKTQ